MKKSQLVDPPKFGASFDAKLCRAVFRICVNPATRKVRLQNGVYLDQEQTYQAIQGLFLLMPELGKTPSKKWCYIAFQNFDEHAGHGEWKGLIRLESWCEIMRQYCRTKWRYAPKEFNSALVFVLGDGVQVQQAEYGDSAERAMADGVNSYGACKKTDDLRELDRCTSKGLRQTSSSSSAYNTQTQRKPMRAPANPFDPVRSPQAHRCWLLLLLLLPISVIVTFALLF